MSIRMNPQLCCDGPGCANAFPHSFGLEHGYQIRVEAVASGWVQRQSGKDYCPACAEDIGPKYIAPRGVCGTCGKNVGLTKPGLLRNHDEPLTRGAKWGRRCLGSHKAPRSVVTS